jgi:hypothetical protein
MNFTLSLTDENGDTVEVELTPGETLDFGAGKAIGYTPRVEQVRVDEDGTITLRERSIPDDPRDES